MTGQAKMTAKRLAVEPNVCDGCGACLAVCPEDALLLPECLVEIIQERCTLCANCLIVCPVKAFRIDRP